MWGVLADIFEVVIMNLHKQAMAGSVKIVYEEYCCYSTYKAKKKVCMKKISIFGEQNNYSMQYK